MFTCFYCGKEKDDKEMSPEHIVPDSCGGGLVTYMVCITCNHKANREIDKKFKEQWMVKWDRALAGIEMRRKGDTFSTKESVINEHGEVIDIEITPEGFRPVAPTEVKWNLEENKVSLMVDPRYYDRAISGVRKKAEKLGLELDIPEQMPQPSLQSVGRVSMETEFDLSVYRREQCKVILAFACKEIPRFIKSQTAEILREYMWNPKPKSRVPGLKSGMFPFNLDKERLGFYLNENIAYTIPRDGKEMSYLPELGMHTLAAYPHNGHIRIFISLFGHNSAFVDTLEPYTYFWPGPIPPPKGIGYLLNPSEKTFSSLNVEEKFELGRSSELAGIAGYLSSHPEILRGKK